MPDSKTSGISPDIVILGAGLAGLTIGRELKRRGYSNLVIAEAADSIGGVWRDNHYPNVACDVPIDVYCLSDHPSAEFSSSMAPATEILAYTHEIARHYQLEEHIRLSTPVTAARWKEADQRWEVTTGRGERWTPRFFIWAGGRLHRPLIPDVPGRKAFRGEVFHTAQWRDDVETAGRRVALVGASATAIQVVPYLAERAQHFYAFMRTPPYCLPSPAIAYSAADRQTRRENPALLAASRQKVEEFLEEHSASRFPMNEEAIAHEEAKWREHFESIVKDPALRELLTPRYRLGCRRLSFSNDFYRSLCQPNVTVLGTGLAGYTSSGVRTEDGREFDVDVVVLATGFEADKMLGDLRVEGRGGIELSEQWKDCQEAYLGVVVKNFPNLFLIDGPNAELASATISMEVHANYVASCLKLLEERGASSLEVRAEVQDAFNAEITPLLNQSTLMLGGCKNWHRTHGGTGRVFTHWPGDPNSMRRRVGEPRLNEFNLELHRTPATVA